MLRERIAGTVAFLADVEMAIMSNGEFVENSRV
jgi:hypothetical protein